LPQRSAVWEGHRILSFHAAPMWPSELDADYGCS
jgi:hypothetical protein